MDANDKLSARVTVNKQGRVVLPAPLRNALHIKPGEELIARVKDEALVLEKFETVEKRLLSWFSGIPADVSLVDELLAERREEARRDNEEIEEWLKAHPVDSS
jgi:AbrB family looped-hinge helix DNA binding protein